MPRLTFENGVLTILEESQVKGIKTPRRACINTLISVIEANEVQRSQRFGLRTCFPVVSLYSVRQTKYKDSLPHSDGSVRQPAQTKDCYNDNSHA